MEHVEHELNGQNSDDDLDLKRYLQLALHHRIIIAFVIGISLILGYIFFTKQEEKYVTSFSVYFDGGKSRNVSGTEGNRPGYVSMDIAYWERVMQADKTYQLVNETGGFGFSTSRTASFFSVTADKTAPLFQVTLTTHSPDIISALTSAFVSSLNTIDKHNQYGNLQNKYEYLLEQLSIDRRRQDSIGNILARYSGVLDFDKIETFDQLRENYDRLQTNVRETEVEAAYVRATRINTEQELQGLNDTIFEKASFTEPLKVQLMNLHVQLARSLTKYGEEHPVVIGVRKNIEQVEKMLSDGFEQNVTIQNLQANPLKRQLMNHIVELKIQELSLQSKVEAMKRVMGELNPDLTNAGNLFHLVREKEELAGRIEHHNRELIDTELAMRWIPDGFYLIDQPAVPVSSSNRSLLFFLAVALFAALAVSVILVIIYDNLDDRIKLIGDFEKRYSIPVLGSIQHRKGKALTDETGKIRESYEEFSTELTTIRINIKQHIKSNNCKLFAMSSPIRKDGKTMLTYLLASEFAAAGKRVLLVDCDSFLPRLSMITSGADEKGFLNYLLEDAPLDEIIKETPVKNLMCIPAGQNNYKVKVLYDTPRMIQLVKEVSEAFDMVFFDIPALLLVPEVAEIVRLMDMNILVTRIGHSTRKSTDKLLERLKLIGKDPAGVIFTDTRLVPLGSYYEKKSDYYYYNYYEKEESRVIEPKPLTEKFKHITGILILVITVFFLLDFADNRINKFSDVSRSILSLPESQSQASEDENVMQLSASPGDQYAGPLTTEVNRTGTEEELSDPGNASAKRFFIIAGSYSDKVNADRHAENLKREGFTKSRNIGLYEGLYEVAADWTIDFNTALMRVEKLNSERGSDWWLLKTEGDTLR